MKRLAPAVALALVVGATQPGCACTAVGALVGLIAGAVCDDPYPDTNDRIRAHVSRSAEIGLQLDAYLLLGICECCWAGRESDGDGRALAFVDPACAKAQPKTRVVFGPTSCVVAYQF